MKTYTLVKYGRRDGEVTGDLNYLKDYFGIKKTTTITALVNKVQKQYDEREAACYNRTFIKLKKEE